MQPMPESSVQSGIMNLKSIFLALTLLGAFACTQVESTETLVEHKCSSSCHGEDHHFKHGEKGHECTPQCKRMRDKKG